MSNVTGGFDLSQVLAQAKQVEAEASEGGSGGKEKLVYPKTGTIKVKLLFNPKSQTVIRRIERHTIGDSKVPCLSYYGQDCPICKILGDIENLSGSNLWKQKRTIRGFCYAEYISDNYKWDNEQEKPQPGEIIMLMFPWTIYQDLNKIMSQAGAKLGQVVASNVGYVINIEKWIEGQQTKYKAAVDAFELEHKTRNTDEEYNEILMNLDDLNEKFMPISINDVIIKKAKDAAEGLTKEYMSPAVSNYGTAGQNLGSMAGAPPVSTNYYRDPTSGQEYDLINNQWVPRPKTPPVPPVPSTSQFGGIPQSQQTQQTNQFMNPPINESNSSNDDKPECYGKHGCDANKCLVCFREADCALASAN